MLILPEGIRKKIRDEHESAKRGLTDHFNAKMEEVLNENNHIDKYWILGKVNFPREYKGRGAKVFLQACTEKPPLVARSFLYEVDNRKGYKTLLWVMHPDNSLSFPTLGKKLSVQTGKTA